MIRGFLSVFFALSLACGGASGSKVDQAVAVAKELRSKPDDAEAILTRNNLTPEQWEALMYEIADDPALSDQFVAGLAK